MRRPVDLSKDFPLNVEIPPEISQYGTPELPRLDQWLARRFPEVSRSRWIRLIDTEHVRVNEKVASPAHRLHDQDKIDLIDTEGLFAEVSQNLHANLKYSGTLVPEILFEDEDILVLNKPPGLAVHPGSGLPLEESLVAWLIENKKVLASTEGDFLHWGEDILEQARPGIVHRLDKGTSGALVVAKNPKAHKNLAKQFEDKVARRNYMALVEGDPLRLLTKRPSQLEYLLRKVPCPVAFRVNGESSFSLATYLERDPKSRVKFSVSPELRGKRAITHFDCVASHGRFSLLRVKLETGRTHQIRVHLSFLGFPIWGDDIYGGHQNHRLFLHAERLSLEHPKTHEKMEFLAPLPEADRIWLEEQKLLA